MWLNLYKNYCNLRTQNKTAEEEKPNEDEDADVEVDSNDEEFTTVKPKQKRSKKKSMKDIIDSDSEESKVSDARDTDDKPGRYVRARPIANLNINQDQKKVPKSTESGPKSEICVYWKSGYYMFSDDRSISLVLCEHFCIYQDKCYRRDCKFYHESSFLEQNAANRFPPLPQWNLWNQKYLP